jgi:diguanylate cyclase (GGDEF)-like protein
MKKDKILELNQTLRTALGEALRDNRNMAEQVRQLEEEIKKLKRISTTDFMTGLGNKMAFDKTLESSIEDYLATGKKFTLAIIDLNDLKKANDIGGHEKGDSLIKSAAGLIHHTIRNNDYAFRIGGDEFAIILSGTENGKPFEKRLHSLAEKSNISLSIGWASTSHVKKSCTSQSIIKEVLFELADSNMYLQKSLYKKKVLPRQ